MFHISTNYQDQGLFKHNSMGNGSVDVCCLVIYYYIVHDCVSGVRSALYIIRTGFSRQKSLNVLVVLNVSLNQ